MDPDSKNGRRFVKQKNSFLDNVGSGNLLKNIWQVSANSIILAVINLLFHFIMSRNLGPSDYGELETLLTINSLLLIGLSAVAIIIARFVSVYRSRQQLDKMKFLVNWSFIFFFLMGMTGFIVNIIFGRLSAGYLKIEDYHIIEIFGMLIWISFLMPIIEGALRGLQEFQFIGKYKILDAVLRLIIGASLIFAGLKIKSIVTGLVISGIITIIFTGYMLRKIYINKPYRMDLRELYLFSIPVFLSTISFAFLANIDLVLVKHFFDATTTGQYAAAAILAKLSVIMAFGSAGVMFPKIVEYYSNGDNKNIIIIFRNTLKIAIIAGAVMTLLLCLFPQGISKAFFGRQYVIGNILITFSIAMFLLSIICVIMMYDLAIRRYKYIPIIMIAAFIEIYQINRLHSTISDIVNTLLVINIVLLLFMIYINRRELFAKFS